MAVLLGVSRLCRLVFYICGIHVYVSTQSVEFTEPTECSPDCSFMNAQGKLRQCSVRQIAISLPTSLSCSSLLPDHFFTNEDKNMPPRFDEDDVKGMFTQSSSNDLKVKIDIEISEPNHDRLNGVFFELSVDGNSDRTYDIRYCFLLDFNSTLKRNDIISSYANGGHLTLSFCPCMDASKSADYSVVGYPLPLITKPMDAPRFNHQYSFSWFMWLFEKCKKDSKRYLKNSELKIYDGRLELKLNSSSLFNYNCPLAFRIVELNTDEKKTVHFNNGVAVASDIEQGEYKLRFILDAIIGYELSLNNAMDVGVTFKGNCLSCPCGNSSICQQHGTKKFKCFCPPGQILKNNKCYDEYPCIDNPCVNGNCTRIETNTSVHYNCTCCSGFYEEHNTCLPDPCFNNPCGNGICNRTNTGIGYKCQCHDGFYIFKNTCKQNYCYGNQCHPGNCTEKDSSYTCNCPSSHQLSDGKCQENESVVMHVVVGLAGGLIGFFLILVFLYVKSRCPELPNPESVDDNYSVSSFDKNMLQELRDLSNSPNSSLAPSSSEDYSARITASFTNGRPLHPISCGSKYHPQPNSVLMPTSLPFNQCQETCRLSCRSHESRFQENGPKVGENYLWREKDAFCSHSPVPYTRDVSIDSQPSTSNHTSVEYYTDRESSC